jgi:hypothetical protein
MSSRAIPISLCFAGMRGAARIRPGNSVSEAHFDRFVLGFATMLDGIWLRRGHSSDEISRADATELLRICGMGSGNRGRRSSKGVTLQWHVTLIAYAPWVL